MTRIEIKNIEQEIQKAEEQRVFFYSNMKAAEGIITYLRKLLKEQILIQQKNENKKGGEKKNNSKSGNQAP